MPHTVTVLRWMNPFKKGENESGKTTLIAKLQGNEDPKKGSGLEYAYIEVRDEYRDEKTRLGVWILDGDPNHSELLEFAVNEKNLEHTLVLLTVSMTTPWAIMDQLHTWASTLQDHIDKLKIDPDKYLEQQKKMVKAWRDYIEPGDELEANSPMKRSSRNLENEEDIDLPLPENVLSRNLGVNVIVVVTKTDYMTTLEKDFDYKEEHFDYIQQSIRKFCLHYGASLFYTSVKEDKNCDLLYKFLVHRIYGFPFKTPALVVEKDAVFIPAGWDKDSKISILYENMHSMSPDDYYTDVIVKPQTARKQITREVEIQAEDENSFLSRHLAQMQGGPGAIPPGSHGRNDASLRQSPAAVSKRVPPASSPSPQPQINSPNKKIDPSKPGVANANEGVLATFFNALLSKKSGTPPPAGATRSNVVDKSLVRSDAAAELDRLARTKHIIVANPRVSTTNNTSTTTGPAEVNSTDAVNNIVPATNNITITNNDIPLIENNTSSINSSSEC
ncbi:Cytoplasmic dynein 1 light intermediate chain 2 [Armadillidium vulgare]|nr:Cytoplasmic dynein 1 light intermediate chain 2 [Armadillidium vulgare]